MNGPFTKEQLDLLYGKAEYLVFFMKQTAGSFVYEYVNPVCSETFGKDLTGTTVDESMPLALAEEIKKQYRKAIELKSFHIYRDENLYSKNKSAFETEVKPVEYGGEKYVIAISKNVSTQKKIEEDYLFYQSLIQNAVDPMIMVTAEYTIFDMNPSYETVFGVDKELWTGRSYGDLPFTDKHFFGKIMNSFEQTKSGETASSFIINKKKSNGEAANFSVNFSPIRVTGTIRAFHIVFRELTNEFQLKQELKKTENVLESYKAALNYAALVAIWQPSGSIQFANDNFKGTTGYEREELLGMNIAEIGRAVIQDEQYDNIRDVILGGIIWRGEMKSIKKTGEYFWVDTTIIPLRNDEGRIYQMLAIMFDITDRKQLEEKLHFMAYHDSLTNLPNRRMMVDQFSLMTAQADSRRQWAVLLFIDGDDFKAVNDRYGHDIGDEFIFHFGQAVEQSVRKGDLASRMGGDEFLVALTGIEPEEADVQIGSIVSRIKENLAKGWNIGEFHFAPTCSIGIAIYPQDARDFEELVQKADSALYQAKQSGKNQVRFYSK